MREIKLDVFDAEQRKAIIEVIRYVTDYVIGLNQRGIFDHLINDYAEIFIEYTFDEDADLTKYMQKYLANRRRDLYSRETKVHIGLTHEVLTMFPGVNYTVEVLQLIEELIRRNEFYANRKSNNRREYSYETGTYEFVGKIDTDVNKYWYSTYKRPQFRVGHTLYRMMLGEPTDDDRVAMLYHIFISRLSGIENIVFFNSLTGKEYSYKITDKGIAWKMIFAMAKINRRSLQYGKCPCGKGTLKIEPLWSEMHCSECNQRYLVDWSYSPRETKLIKLTKNF